MGTFVSSHATVVAAVLSLVTPVAARGAWARPCRLALLGLPLSTTDYAALFDAAQARESELAEVAQWEFAHAGQVDRCVSRWTPAGAAVLRLGARVVPVHLDGAEQARLDRHVARAAVAHAQGLAVPRFRSRTPGVVEPPLAAAAPRAVSARAAVHAEVRSPVAARMPAAAPVEDPELAFLNVGPGLMTEAVPIGVAPEWDDAPLGDVMEVPSAPTAHAPSMEIFERGRGRR